MARFLLCIWDDQKDKIIASTAVTVASCVEAMEQLFEFAASHAPSAHGTGFALDDEACELVNEALKCLPYEVQELIRRGLL